jgi:hypothetical protein
MTCLSHLITNAAHLNWQQLLPEPKNYNAEEYYFLLFFFASVYISTAIPEDVRALITKARVETFAQRIILQITHENYQHV